MSKLTSILADLQPA